MASLPSLPGPCSVGAPVSFCLLLICSVFLPGIVVPALAADQVTFSWRANPQSDNVIGYRLYYGGESRFDETGSLKANFSYTWYLDFSRSLRCLLTDSGPICERFSDDDVLCQGMSGESPSCTLFQLEGRYYFAMTAYNTLAESDYTPELSGDFTVPDSSGDTGTSDGEVSEDSSRDNGGADVAAGENTEAETGSSSTEDAWDGSGVSEDGTYSIENRTEGATTLQLVYLLLLGK